MQRRLSAHYKRNERAGCVRGRKSTVEADTSLLDTLLFPLAPLDKLHTVAVKEVVEATMPRLHGAELLKRRASTCSTAASSESGTSGAISPSSVEARCENGESGRRRIFGGWAPKVQKESTPSNTSGSGHRNSTLWTETESSHVVEVPVGFISFLQAERGDKTDVSSLSSDDTFFSLDENVEDEGLTTDGDCHNVSSCSSAQKDDIRIEEEAFQTSQSCDASTEKVDINSSERRSIFKEWNGPPLVYPRTRIEDNTEPEELAIPKIPQCAKNDPVVREMMLRNVGAGIASTKADDNRRPVIFGRVGKHSRVHGSAHVLQAPSPVRELRKTSSTTALLPHRSLQPSRSCLRAVQAYSRLAKADEHTLQTRQASTEKRSNTRSRTKRLVTFHPHVAVREFEKPLEVWAPNDWAKWFV